MLKQNPDPLAQNFDAVLNSWLARNNATAPLRVNFRSLVNANSGIDRFTHLLHPYPAKLLLNIPLFFLNCPSLGKPGSKVMDPFCGTGTVLLEGLIAGRNVIGADANPLARLISSAKTTVISPQKLERYLAGLVKSIPRYGDGVPQGAIDLEDWYAASVLRKMDRLASALRKREPSAEKTFFQACLSVVANRVSLADPTVSVPVRLNPKKKTLNAEQRKQRKIWLEEKITANPFDAFQLVAQRNIARMGRLYEHLPNLPQAVIGTDARTVKASGVDLIITSPPYGSAQKYVRASGLGLQWLNLADNGLRPLERQIIGREHFDKLEQNRGNKPPPKSARPVLKKIEKHNPLRAFIAEAFLSEMREALEQSARQLNAGGHMVLVVGNNIVCGHVFDTRKYLVEICESLGLTLELVLIDHIRSRGLATKRHSTANVIPYEWILLFRK
jgi:hypothetical protein